MKSNIIIISIAFLILSIIYSDIIQIDQQYKYVLTAVVLVVLYISLKFSKNNNNNLSQEQKQIIEAIVRLDFPKFQKLFLDNKMNPNMRDKRGFTLLQLVIGKLLEERKQIKNKFGQEQKDNMDLYISYKMFKFLLENKADPNECNNSGQSAFFMISNWGFIDLMYLCLRYGANVNQMTTPFITEYTRNPLYTVLIRYDINWQDIALILLENGADIEQTKKIHAANKIEINNECFEFLDLYKSYKQKQKNLVNMHFVRQFQIKRLKQQDEQKLPVDLEDKNNKNILGRLNENHIQNIFQFI